MKRRPAAASRKKRRKSPKITPGTILRYSFLVLLAAFVAAMAYQYRHGLLYYLGFRTDKRIEALSKEKGRLANLRFYEILERHKDKAYGIDVSHYQGDIDWPTLKQDNPGLPVKFVFIRATAGEDRDSQFTANWEASKKHGYIRGAYHYYRPDENSLDQADNFISTVKLSAGDLPPVLDIEKIPSRQSMERLKTGLKKWLVRVENHYGMKPVIYSGESFYTDFLKEEFQGYSLWIANYSFFEEEIRKEWLFWQFTDKAKLNGIKGHVDVNIFNGEATALNALIKR